MVNLLLLSTFIYMNRCFWMYSFIFQWSFPFSSWESCVFSVSHPTHLYLEILSSHPEQDAVMENTELAAFHGSNPLTVMSSSEERHVNMMELLHFSSVIMCMNQFETKEKKTVKRHWSLVLTASPLTRLIRCKFHIFPEASENCYNCYIGQVQLFPDYCHDTQHSLDSVWLTGLL